MVKKLTSLDFGSSAVKVINLKYIKKLDQINIKQTKVYEYNKVYSKKIAYHELQDIINILRKEKLLKYNIIISLPVNDVIFKVLPSTEVKSEQEIENVLANLGNPIKYIYDLWEPKHNKTGISYLFASPKNTIDQLIGLFSTREQKNIIITAEPLALFNLARYYYPKLDELMIVDLGCQGTKIIHLNNDCINLVREVDFNSYYFTEIIMHELQLLYQDAKKLKEKDNYYQKNNASKYLQFAVNNLIREIDETNIYLKRYCDFRTETVLITGGGVDLKSFRQLLIGNLAMNVKLFAEDYKIPSCFATALGGALGGVRAC